MISKHISWIHSWFFGVLEIKNKDIIVNIISPSKSEDWILNINNYKIPTISSLKNQNKEDTIHFIAYRFHYSGEFNYYSFSSALINNGQSSTILKVEPGCTISFYSDLSLNNVRVLTDEDILSTESSKELTNLKLFVNGYKHKQSTHTSIILNRCISKLTTKIHQPFNDDLAKAKEYEFILDENLPSKFEIEGSLIESVPDYVSLGYDRYNPTLISYGIPITLSINTIDISKKAVSIFQHLWNKNIQTLNCFAKISRSKSLCTKPEIAFLWITRQLKTLKFLTLTLTQDSSTYSYTFRDLTPARLQLIIDSVFGHDPSLPAPGDLSELTCMESLLTISDSIQIIT